MDKSRNLANGSYLNCLSPDYLVVGREKAPGSRIFNLTQPEAHICGRSRKVTSGCLRTHTLRHTKGSEVRHPRFSHLPPAYCETWCGRINTKELGTFRKDTVRGCQESIQLSGAYSTRQTSWRRKERRGNRPSKGLT